MNIEFYYFLICIIIPRLFAQWNDEPIDKSIFYRILLLFTVEAFLFIPFINVSGWIAFFLLAIVYHCFQFIINLLSKNIILNRIISFIFIILISSFVFGIFPDRIIFNDLSASIIKKIIKNNAIFIEYSSQAIKKGIIYIFGILALINEINHIIRYILKLIGTEPQHHQSSDNLEEFETDTTDQQELYRGKIIGVIERILFFFIVVTNHYGSIGFILIAKGFTRYKKLNDKSFAEYVLIGTLLSASLSILWAYYIKMLLNYLWT
jgi:hypothetical protein